MALKTKAKTAKIGEVLGKKPNEFTFIDPPMIDAPNTQVFNLDGSPRQLPDPSKTLKPAQGVERLKAVSPFALTSEKGPNGESVYEIDSRDSRVRYVGDWHSEAAGQGANVRSGSISTDTFAEVTFYGTGLNALCQTNVPFGEVFVDGVSIGTPSTAGSTVLNSRDYQTNVIFPITKGLPLGIHTIRLTSSVFNALSYGFEILNESAQIQVPQGEVWAAGNKFSNSALTAIDYNSDFEGSPVLNGRGGRVSVCIDSAGDIKKYIQQTDASQGNLGSADHSNEEMIRRINFREFGANRGDDFSTLAGIGDKAYTLDDGTTTLVGNDVIVDTGNMRPGGAIGVSFFTLTFVGTGLDLVVSRPDGTAGTNGHSVEVDGVVTATDTLAFNHGANEQRIVKVVSGLPYGTHTVKIIRGNPSAVVSGFDDFIIYGPKKPSIPADEQEISEYYLMADYDSSGFTGDAVADYTEVPQGTLAKASIREFVYEGAGWAVQNAFDRNPFGFHCSTSASDSFSYTFFGTGTAILLDGSGAAGNFTVEIDESLDATGTPLANITNSGGGTYQHNATSTEPCKLEFTGLTLGVHTIKLTRSSSIFQIVGLFVITPIHFPNTKVGSLSMGPGVQIQKETSTGGVDLGKAKVLLAYNRITSEILFSKNVAAVINGGTGDQIIHFEKPMKGEYVAAISSAEGQAFNLDNIGQRTPDRIVTRTTGSTGTVVNTEYLSVAIFGELQDEEEE